jgi:hypothetical protein
MTRSMIRTWRHGSAALASPQNPTAPVDMARTLEMLAVRVGQLSPSWRSPEHFAAERSDIAHQLRRLAQRARDVVS